MQREIEGRSIVITGAASGLGRAWALGFLREGARVVAADIDEVGLADAAAEGAVAVRTDVSSARDVEALIERCRRETGRVDVLFNNAGFGSRHRIEEMPAGEFERMLAVHVFGALYGLRAAIPIMREQGHGRIVNTLSRAAEICAAGGSAYSAAKAALFALTRSAARETEATDILINGLIPGPTNTAIWGRDMPRLQAPEATYPAARVLALLPAGGPSGQVFWNQKPYPLMHPDNPFP